MGRHTQHQELYVYMNGVSVGILIREPSGHLMFTYDLTWLNTKESRPISLSMPLTAKPYTGYIVDYYFENLLPDNELIRKRIQTRFNTPSKKCFDLLSSVGRDCVGALQILTQSDTINVRTINANPIDNTSIAKLLKNYQTAPLGMDPELDFRISIAGAQEKTALLWHKNQWCLPHGTTPTSHILKLPIGFIHHQQMDLSESCENEWLCSKIAEAFGLPIANSEILHFEDIKVLAVERFDRQLSQDKTWIMRLPQEDMCQALGISPNLKYQADGGPGITDIIRLLLGSNNPIEDTEIFFRSQILFWLLAAIDGHAKNFSLFIQPEGRYRLTPLYDIMSAYPLITKKQLQPQKIKMAMCLKGKNNHYHWHNIQRRHFLSAANTAHYSAEKAEALLNDMLEKVDNIITLVSAQLPNTFPKHISQPIFEGMHTIKQRLIQLS